MVNNQFSWENFQTNNSQKPQFQSTPVQSIEEDTYPPIQEDVQPQENNYSWGQFLNTSTYQGKPDPTEDESTFGYLARNLVSNTARLFENINPVARVGNMQELLQNVTSKIPETTGILGKALHSFMGQEKWDKMIYGNELSPKVPTSRDLKEVTDTLTGGYTKPKTKVEEGVQDFSSDVGSVIGAGRFTRNRLGMPEISRTRSLVNNLGIPAASNTAKAVVEDLGFGEDKANWTKLAAWTSLSLMNNVNASAYAANLMNRGRTAFSPLLGANIPRYQGNINTVSRQMLHGDPRSSLAQQQLNGIYNDIQNGQTSMRDLMNRYDAINAAKRDKGLFQLGRSDRRAAIRNIDTVRHAVRREIEELGQANPEALENWRNGVQAFAVIHQSNAMTNWIQSIAKGPYSKILTGPIAGLFGVSGYGAAKVPMVGLTASTITPALYKGGQVAYRVWNDPSLSRYYWEALNAARQQNQDVFIRKYDSLNKEYERKYKAELPSGINPNKKNNGRNAA
jgi:hypothetical protein